MSSPPTPGLAGIPGRSTSQLSTHETPLLQREALIPDKKIALMRVSIWAELALVDPSSEPL